MATQTGTKTHKTRSLTTPTIGDQMTCKGFDTIPAHNAGPDDFSTGKTRCRACTSAYFKSWAAKKAAAGATKTVAAKPVAPVEVNPVAPVEVTQTVKMDTHADSPVQRELAVHAERSIGHTYRPDPKLVSLWQAILKAGDAGDHIVLAMHGPRGSGKTDGAEHLAALADRPLVKIDAKSIIDAEAWFGSRGAQDGTTFYAPSEFVKALQSRCVIFIDEYTRCSNEVRDVLNPFMDGTRSVMNPITGERIKMHPDCIVILAGNVGFKYTGTFDVDPATTSRLAVFNVDYADPDTEQAILVEHAKIDAEVAKRFVMLATETRNNPQMTSVSTRELIHAAVLVRNGLSEDEAIEAKIIAPASDQGNEGSARAKLTTLWTGHRAGAATTDATEGAAGTVEVHCTNCNSQTARFVNCATCGQWVA